MNFLENFDIDMRVLQNIDINKILYRLEFGVSNRAMCTITCTSTVFYDASKMKHLKSEFVEKKRTNVALQVTMNHLVL